MKVAQFVPKHGRGKLNTGGTKGHKGAGGRPPKEWTSFCEESIKHPDVQAAAFEVMTTPHARGQIAALGLVASYAVGKPVERIEHSGSSERVLRVIYEPLPPLPRREAVPVATARIVKAEP